VEKLCSTRHFFDDLPLTIKDYLLNYLAHTSFCGSIVGVL